MTSPATPLSSPLDRALRSLPALWQWMDRPLNALRSPLAVAGRLYVAQAFFLSGLTKLRDWETTLALFSDEYHVPLLPPQVAAYMGTAGEIGLPILLALGLGGRFAPLGLSVVNVVAVLSLSDIAPAALQQHMSWGIVLAALAVCGPGGWAADRLWTTSWLRAPALR